jgi:Spy/CpxP family protein refolding chaperone
MLAQHDQASKRWTQAMAAAANVLTPQQRAQLAEEMRKHAEHGPGSHGWGR